MYTRAEEAALRMARLAHDEFNTEIDLRNGSSIQKALITLEQIKARVRAEFPDVDIEQVIDALEDYAASEVLPPHEM